MDDANRVVCATIYAISLGALTQQLKVDPMTRTTKHALLFTVFFLFGVSAIVAIGLGLAYLIPNWWGGVMIVLAGISLFVPGRLLAHYWRDYFTGQKLQGRGKHVEALVHFDRFLKALRTHPKLNRYIYFSEWIYTRSAEVLTLNNMAVSYLRLKNTDEAQKLLEEAQQIDPGSPLPHFNLAVVHHALGNKAIGDQHLSEAGRLGYRKGSIQLLAKASEEAVADDETDDVAAQPGTSS
jgi:tetratricopeptide (TPR) repeat protein